MNSDCNVGVIPEEYSVLKKEYMTLKQQIDITKQELYASKRNLQVLEALQNDYQNEVDLLQSNSDGEKKMLEEKILQLQDMNNNLKLKYSDRIEGLEQKLHTYEEENISLKNELEISKKSNAAVHNDSFISKLNDDILTLREENLSLLDCIGEKKDSIDALQKQNLVLEEMLLV